MSSAIQGTAELFRHYTSVPKGPPPPFSGPSRPFSPPNAMTTVENELDALRSNAHTNGEPKEGRNRSMQDVNRPAMIICFAIVAVFLVLGVHWVRKPDTRRRGIIVLAIILVPTFISGLVVSARLLAF